MTYDDIDTWQVIYGAIEDSNSNMASILLKTMILRLRSAWRLNYNDEVGLKDVRKLPLSRVTWISMQLLMLFREPFTFKLACNAETCDLKQENWPRCDKTHNMPISMKHDLISQWSGKVSLRFAALSRVICKKKERTRPPASARAKAVSIWARRPL